MASLSIPYLPADYQSLSCGEITTHFSPRERTEHVQFVQHVALEALARVQSLLAFEPQRALHLCCYHRCEEAQEALDRNLSPTFAMAPYSDQETALVIIHSPELSKLNANRGRMIRIVAHELTHQLALEVTGSTKILGDGNRNMRISSWLNEGLAEVVGFLTGQATERLAACLDAFGAAADYQTFDTLSTWLDELDDARRSIAFVHATAGTEMLRQRLGLAPLFNQISAVEDRIAGHAICTPTFMRLCSDDLASND